MLGYIRVSTVDQNTDRQLDGERLDRVFEDKASAKDSKRPALQQLLTYVREGDTVVVHSLDRLARNVDDLRRIVDDLTSRGVTVKFLKNGLTFRDHGDPQGKFYLTMLAAIAEFERSLILERQREGIAIAKREGKYRGRQPSLTPEQVTEAKQRLDAGVPHARVARDFGVSRQTLYAQVKAVCGQRKVASTLSTR